MRNIKINVNSNNKRDVKDSPVMDSFNNSFNETHNYYSEKDTGVAVDIDKSKTEMKTIIRNKVIESIIGAAFGAAAFIAQQFFTNSLTTYNVIILFVTAALVITALVIIISATINIFQCLSLRKNGKFIELKTKSSTVNDVKKVFSNKENEYELRRTGKIYKNIDGTIYQLMGCECPFCKSGTIGHMSFAYNPLIKSYQLICSENPDNHILNFDYKIEV